MAKDDPVADALHDVASAIHRLGNGDAMTPMGGMEAHGKAILDAAKRIGEALEDVASASREWARANAGS